METVGKKPRRRRSFTPEFKAEIVGLCSRVTGQLARSPGTSSASGTPARTSEGSE
jgi:transposase-like protein